MSHGEKNMTTVDFYLFNETNLDEFYRKVCHLIEKNFNPDKKIYIHTDSKETSEKFDILLWTFHDVSFLPHAIYTRDIEFSVPILIGNELNTDLVPDILVNLTNTTPDSSTKFQHIFEVVLNDENYKKNARERYKIYKAQNCKLALYNLE